MWDNQFESILRRYLPFISAGEQLDASAQLRDLGLDSLATVELLSELESAYHVRFADDALTLETFETAAAAWQALSGARAPAS